MMESQPLKSCDYAGSKSVHGSIGNTDTIENDVSYVPKASEDNDEEPPKPEPFKWSKLSRTSQYTLLTCSVGIFFSGCEFYFIVSFFPKVAEEKEVPSTIIGLTFSIFHITMFLLSPIYGAYISKIGAKFLYLSGTFIGGCATILFGLANLCDPGVAFIVPSMTCRSMMAVGISAFVTAGFAILSNEFPNHIATAFGIVEVANGFGLMSGPVVGGVLYQYGGFGTPFFVVGGLLFVNGLFLYVVLPPPKSKPKPPTRKSPWILATSGLFCIAFFNFFIISLGISFLDPTLGIRLEMFDVSTSVVGLVFLISPASYAIMAPVYGYLTDVKCIPETLMMFGTTIMGLCYLLMGPCPKLYFLPTDFWMVVMSVAMTGLAFGGVTIPTTKCMVTGAIEIGFPDNIETYGLVSGVFYAGMCAGGFCGTTLGGVLIERYDFPFSSMIIALINLSTTIITLVYFTIRRKRRNMNNENRDASVTTKDDDRPRDDTSMQSPLQEHTGISAT